MSAEAQFVTICPFYLAKHLDILPYVKSYYEGCPKLKDMLIMFGFMYTSSAYRDACIAYDLEPYDVINNKIESVAFPQEHKDQSVIIQKLLDRNCPVWLDVSF